MPHLTRAPKSATFYTSTAQMTNLHLTTPHAGSTRFMQPPADPKLGESFDYLLIAGCMFLDLSYTVVARRPG